MSNYNEFPHCLSGSDPFYKRNDYSVFTLGRFLARGRSPDVAYVVETESKIAIFVKRLFSILVLPVYIGEFLHKLAGRIAVPASQTYGWELAQKADGSQYERRFSRRERALECRSCLPFNSDDTPWRFKRFTVVVDGVSIDAAIVGTEATLANGSWVLASCGNATLYEESLYDESFIKLINKLGSNALVFNYPGVGESSGAPSRKSLRKAYRAMLAFLEDKEHGIGAKEIIGYGHSLGGGIQADALRGHQFKSDIKYVFIKSRTFSSVAAVVESFTNRFGAFIAKIFGWNIDTAAASRVLPASEIIIQTANVDEYTELEDASLIVSDDVIHGSASLARALVGKKDTVGKKCIIGVPEHHNELLSNVDYLVAKVKGFLGR